jgi:hypothetical protein
MELGENLSGSAYLDFLTAPSPEELKAQIRMLRTPHKLVSIYAAGSVHVAWILPMFPNEVERIKKRGRPPLKKDGVT